MQSVGLKLNAKYLKVMLDGAADVCILIGMKITPEANANTKKRQIAWFTIEGEHKHVEHADMFLGSIGVDMCEVTTDEIDGEFYTSFPVWISETKAKDMKHMRIQLREFMKQKGASQ